MPTPTPSWTDALSGLFQDPVFLLGANLAALSGQHRFPQALGGAALQTGGLMAELQAQAQREAAQKQELEMRGKYLGIAEEEAKAERGERERQEAARTRMTDAIAKLPIPDDAKLMFNYMVQMGQIPPIALTPKEQAAIDLRGQPSVYSTYRMGVAEEERQREAEERTRKEMLKRNEIARIEADPTMNRQQKDDALFAINMGRAPPKRESAADRQIREALEAQQGQQAEAGAAAAASGQVPVAPVPEGPSFLEALGGRVRDWWQGGGAAAAPPQTPLAPPTPTPLAPQSNDPLAAIEASLPTLTQTERAVAKRQLQQMLANPAMAGLRGRIQALLGQL